MYLYLQFKYKQYNHFLWLCWMIEMGYTCMTERTLGLFVPRDESYWYDSPCYGIVHAD